MTKLGKTMAFFPVNPRYAKMLTLASQNSDPSILSYTILLIAGLSVPELLLDSPSLHQLRAAWLPITPESNIHLLGDLSIVLIALGALEYESDARKTAEFCERFGVRAKSVVEARKLRRQLVNAINCLQKLDLVIDPGMKPPSEDQARKLRQIVMSGMPDRLARLRIESQDSLAGEKGLKNAYEGLILEQPLFIHPSSSLFKKVPPYVCYVDIIETSKLYMRLVCAFDSDWLPEFLPNECSFDRPIVEANDELTDRQPRFDMEKGVVVCHRESTFGPLMWRVRPVEVEWLPAELELFKWFARFLLEGKVIEGLRKYENVLLASPSTMLKSWAK